MILVLKKVSFSFHLCIEPKLLTLSHESKQSMHCVCFWFRNDGDSKFQKSFSKWKYCLPNSSLAAITKREFYFSNLLLPLLWYTCCTRYVIKLAHNHNLPLYYKKETWFSKYTEKYHCDSTQCWKIFSHLCRFYVKSVWAI